MTAEEAEALHDYIIDVEWRAYKLGPRGVKGADSAPAGADTHTE
jgi:hypothetical protein